MRRCKTGVTLLRAELPRILATPHDVLSLTTGAAFTWVSTVAGVSAKASGLRQRRARLPEERGTPVNGGVVRGTVGANFQTGEFVFGVEGDWDYPGINTGTSTTICSATGACQVGNNWLATVRGRAGWAADRVLFYGTAGGAFANVQAQVGRVTTTKTQSGWTAGAGVQWAFADNWTARVEYLYVDLGTYSGTYSSAGCLAATGTTGIPFRVNLT
ncbi:MAG TPA: outer membrane beta-barrel protein [Steroidobacteraceae bacterium]